jgi:hypothetical protein
MVAIGSAGPLWAYAYISASPFTTNSLSLHEMRALSLIPTPSVLLLLPSLSIGYFFTGIIMSLPTPGTIGFDAKQVAIATWNVFPLLIFLLLGTLSHLIPSNVKSTTDSKVHLPAVRWTYAVTGIISFFTHAGIVASSLASVCFPSVFSAPYVEALSPGSLLLPPIFSEPGNTVGDGVRGFFMWDQIFGYSAVLFVALLQYRAVTILHDPVFSLLKSLVGILVGTAVVGPGVVCLFLSWRRDEMLFAESYVRSRSSKSLSK